MGDLIVNALCTVYCYGKYRYRGEKYGEHFPRDQRELEQMGIPWLTKALRGNGTLPLDVEVTRIRFEKNNSGGLLGDMCLMYIEYSTFSYKYPPKLMAKFRPPDTHTRLTTTLFRQCQHEYEFYNRVQPGLSEIIRTPKMVWGDFHKKSGTFVMLLEFVEGKFYRIQETIPQSQLLLSIKALACYHAYWHLNLNNQTISWVPKIGLNGYLKIVPGAAAGDLKKLYKGMLAKEANSMPKEIKVLLAEVIGQMGKQHSILEHSGQLDDWLTLNHGDTRIDNWFFDEKQTKDDGQEAVNKVGILDFQFAMKNVGARDLSNIFCVSFDTDTGPQCEELIQVYFSEYTSAVGRLDLTIAEFKEELALQHLGYFVLLPIGAAGLDASDPNTVDVMGLLWNRTIKAIYAHDSLNVWKKFKAGKLISQQKQRLGLKGSPTARQPLPLRSKHVRFSEEGKLGIWWGPKGVVLSVDPGDAAAKLGVNVGDRLVHVKDGADDEEQAVPEDIAMQDLTALILGLGRPCTLTFVPKNGAPVVVVPPSATKVIPY
jgi:hypothetical protein